MAPDTASTLDLLSPLNALANPHRLDLLHLLRDPAAHFPPQRAGPADEIGVCVTDLQEKLRLSQSTTSQYLALLERSGLVAAQRIGQWTYWKLKEDRVRAWIARLENALTHPAGMRSNPRADPVKLQDILAARPRIQPHIRCTPLEPSAALSRLAGSEVRIKFEQLQHTGSSAPRAAVNWLRQVREEKPGAGVVATGTTPREIALAYAGQRLGVPVCVHVPDSADSQVTQTLAAYGAEVRRQPDRRTAEEAALALTRDQGWLLPPTLLHPAVLGGLGTIALEIVEEFGGLESAVVPMDDPGLFLALNHALRTIDPGIKVFGIRGPFSSEDTDPADPAFPSSVPVDRVVTVSGDQLRSAAAWTLAEHQLALPPAAAATIAFLLSEPAEIRGHRVAAVVPGREAFSAFQVG